MPRSELRAPHKLTCSTAPLVHLSGHLRPLRTHSRHACAQGWYTCTFSQHTWVTHLCASPTFLSSVRSLAHPRAPPNTPGRAGRTLAGSGTGRPACPPRTLSACPSARGSAVVNAAFDGGRICCARSERAPIIWKAEIRNTIYSAALWKQFPALYNPILGQPPGAGQITIGYSLSSPGTKISRPR